MTDYKIQGNVFNLYHIILLAETLDIATSVCPTELTLLFVGIVKWLAIKQTSHLKKQLLQYLQHIIQHLVRVG